LRDALQASGKVGVTTFVLRNKEALAVLKPYKNVIVLNKIRFEEEIRDTGELNLPPISLKKSKEMEMANKLIDQLTEKFNIDNYKDTYTDKLLAIIKDKAKGRKPKHVKLKVVHKAPKDLMTMLKASLTTKKRKAS
jgi:DNA end-binding protein Ku